MRRERAKPALLAAPPLRTIHAPQLDLAVVCAGDDEGQGGVEGGPVDAAVVALQHILDHGVAAAKQVRIHLQWCRREWREWRDGWVGG